MPDSSSTVMTRGPTRTFRKTTGGGGSSIGGGDGDGDDDGDGDLSSGGVRIRGINTGRIAVFGLFRRRGSGDALGFLRLRLGCGLDIVVLLYE